MSMKLGARPARGETRRQVLEILKKSDGMTADQLAAEIGVTSMAVRKHLAALERDGLIETTNARRAVGRPVNVYRVSPLAAEAFPNRYDEIATGLLTDLARLDGMAKANLLLERREERTRAFLRQRVAGARTLDERVDALARGMDELGYLATWEKESDGSYMLKQYNCAVNRVACSFPATCDFELETFRLLLGADVERACHIPSGDHHCAYRIVPKTTATTAGS